MDCENGGRECHERSEAAAKFIPGARCNSQRLLQQEDDKAGSSPGAVAVRRGLHLLLTGRVCLPERDDGVLLLQRKAGILSRALRAGHARCDSIGGEIADDSASKLLRRQTPGVEYKRSSSLRQHHGPLQPMESGLDLLRPQELDDRSRSSQEIPSGLARGGYEALAGEESTVRVCVQLDGKAAGDQKLQRSSVAVLPAAHGEDVLSPVRDAQAVFRRHRPVAGADRR